MVEFPNEINITFIYSSLGGNAFKMLTKSKKEEVPCTENLRNLFSTEVNTNTAKAIISWSLMMFFQLRDKISMSVHAKLPVPQTKTQ